MKAYILSRTTLIFKTRRLVLRVGIERVEKPNTLLIARKGLKIVLKNQFEYKFAMGKRQEFTERLKNLL
ncbi:hypothetical protein CHH86_23335 [Bacillus paralicheniformis]|nr:hypothetical protein [Bacillus paralicheniformis]PAC94707.1 hypothetical protein CHH86_23335 [Bacillus paralicheniformis]POO76526.1 hypothetical protein C1T30_42570 [Bacillus sp. MBGLi97]RZV60403.1 hypothetical protein EX342_21950 [Bacillus paralicheniformis]